MKKIKSEPNAKVRILSNRNGRVAFSFRMYCEKSHAKKSTAKKTRSTMTRQSLHGYWAPPHSSTNTKQITHARSSTVPIRSSFPRKVRRSQSLPEPNGLGLEGSFMKKTTHNSATAPRGRLIQKHHPVILCQQTNFLKPTKGKGIDSLQPALSVRTPVFQRNRQPSAYYLKYG